MHGAKGHKTKPDSFYGNEASQDRVLREPISKMLFGLRQMPLVEVQHLEFRAGSVEKHPKEGHDAENRQAQACCLDAHQEDPDAPWREFFG